MGGCASGLPKYFRRWEKGAEVAGIVRVNGGAGLGMGCDYFVGKRADDGLHAGGGKAVDVDQVAVFTR